MTAIEYGGGPSVQQRKDFCNLPNGAHIPNYMGYCPQFKFNHGLSFGLLTAKIASKLPHYKGPVTPSELYLTPRVGDGKISCSSKVLKDEIPRDKIPKSTCDNKYTENMVPGYSGDVPHMPFKFGSTYKHLCDECIDEFVTEYEKHEKDSKRLRELSGLFPKLKPVRHNPACRDHMNLWVDDYLQKIAGSIGQRGPTEPPVPGYTGYIPKFKTTDLSTGSSYNHGVEKCLNVFRMDTKNHFDRLTLPVEPTKPNPERLGPPPSGLNEDPNTWRIFRNPGVIPQYTGHVHELNFMSGRTVGDASRNLEVCSHHFPSYGLFVRNRDLVEAAEKKT